MKLDPLNRSHQGGSIDTKDYQILIVGKKLQNIQVELQVEWVTSPTYSLFQFSPDFLIGYRHIGYQ